MENALICNGDKCRKELTTRALVTSCGHIFCLDCGQKFGLVAQGYQRCPVCPACTVQLPKDEDVALANTNPSEEYKSCVLSGLSPDLIMECAGRAINFWLYQAANELQYQEFLYRRLEGKNSTLGDQFDQMRRDAFAEISDSQDKLRSMTVSRDDLRQKYSKLEGAYQGKSRQLYQTQDLYNKVKNRAELTHIEQAANEVIDNSIAMIEQATIAPLHRQNEGGRLSTEIFRPSVASNVKLPRGDDMRPSAAGPGFSQLSDVCAGVGFTSRAKIGRPAHHSGRNGSLKDL